MADLVGRVVNTGSVGSAEVALECRRAALLYRCFSFHLIDLPIEWLTILLGS